MEFKLSYLNMVDKRTTLNLVKQFQSFSINKENNNNHQANFPSVQINFMKTLLTLLRTTTILPWGQVILPGYLILPNGRIFTPDPIPIADLVFEIFF